MNLLSVGTGYLVLGLFVINFLAILLIRSEGRFWFPGVIFWLLMFCIVVLIHVMNDVAVDRQELVYSDNTVTDDQQTVQLEEFKDKTSGENVILFRLLGFQTVFSCIWQFLGYSSTGKKYYRTSAITFTLLSIVFGITELLRLL
jgi:hypothetical protein